MFEKRDVRALAGTKAPVVWPRLRDWWSRMGFHLAITGPYRVHGTSFSSFSREIGLRREFDLVLTEDSSGCTVDLNFSARVTDEGILLGAVSAVVFWPVAVVGGAVSYTQYEADAQNLMGAFWQYAYSLTSQGTPASARMSDLTTQCAGCGAAMLPDWKVCPYCGRGRDAKP